MFEEFVARWRAEFIFLGMVGMWVFCLWYAVWCRGPVWVRVLCFAFLVAFAYALGTLMGPVPE